MSALFEPGRIPPLLERQFCGVAAWSLHWDARRWSSGRNVAGSPRLRCGGHVRP